MRHETVRAAFAAAALLGLAGLAQAQEKIRLGILPFSESLPAIIADKQGYFKSEGLSVEMTSFASGALSLPLLQSGRLDITFSNTVATLQALEQGLDATLLAPGASVRSQAPDSTTAIMVLKGAAKTPKDLEGKRVAVPVINSTGWMYTVAFFEKHGVERSKIRYVEIPAPQMNDPLLNKQVDAIGQVEPFRTVIMDTGKVDAIGYPYVEAQPNGDITQYVALASWVKKNPQAAAAFARAIVKGAQFANANEALTREINQQFTKLNPALKDRVMLPQFAYTVSVTEIRKTMDLMLRYGLMKQPVDLAGRVLAQP
jgi:NitT/TauT family transport system substrate-binding protein